MSVQTYTITLHDTDNCGSSLQAFALQKFLLAHNIKNKIIDYTPSYVKTNGHPIKNALKSILYIQAKMKKNHRFIEFKSDYLCTTESKYRTYSQLCNIKHQSGDVFITGSDQLWNDMYYCGNDPAFYLGFIGPEVKKIAYAVSIGRKNIPEANLSMIKRYINDFFWVSFREKSAARAIHNLVPAVPCDHVSDPVLLNDISVYETISAPRQIGEDYVLIYVAQKSKTEEINNVISELRRIKTGIKVVSIGSFKKYCSSDYHISDYGPREFVSLIRYAEFIISNSFHATLLSIMFENAFAAVLPDGNGERISELLRMTKLEQCIWQKGSKLCVCKNDIKQGAIILSDFAKSSGEKLLAQLT